MMPEMLRKLSHSQQRAALGSMASSWVAWQSLLAKHILTFISLYSQTLLLCFTFFCVRFGFCLSVSVCSSSFAAVYLNFSSISIFTNDNNFCFICAMCNISTTTTPTPTAGFDPLCFLEFTFCFYFCLLRVANIRTVLLSLFSQFSLDFYLLDLHNFCFSLQIIVI